VTNFHRPLIIAHRGASFEAPENTLAAFERAWRQGADGIECDIRLTRDGEIICLHDPTTERIAAPALDPAKSTLVQLRALDAGAWKDGAWAGEKIPTLGAVLATIPSQARIYIEIKCGVEIFAPLRKILAGSSLAPEQVIIICFDPAVMIRAAREMPGHKRLLLRNITAHRPLPTAHRILTLLNETCADGLDIRAHRSVGPTLLERLRETGKELHVWTVDELAEALRYRDMGVDSITTNRPGLLKEAIAVGLND